MTSSEPASAPARDRAPVELPQRARIEIFVAVLLGLFLAALDQTIVGTALPRIITDLRGNELYTWAFTAYLLTATISGPLYGKLSDLFGRKPMLLIGLVIFLVGSLLSGLSGEMWQLIAFRALQGIGAGALFPIALAVIGDIFAPSERGKYQGFFGAVFGMSSLIGPGIGGLITDTIGWQWVFFVNLPIGAVVIYIVWRLLPTVRSRDVRPSIDYLGAALFVAALVPILVGLTNKQFGEWTDPQVGGLIVLGVVVAAVFLFAESRAAEPIVPLRLFRNPTFAISVAAFFLVAMGMFATFVFLPRWFQVVEGTSATESGYQILALLVGLITSATTAGQLVSRTGRYKLFTAGALVLLAFGLFLLTNLRADTPRPVLWAWMLVAGLGVGPSFAVFSLIVQNSVPFRDLGAATSNLTLFQQVGGTVGLAMTGTIFGSRLLEEIPRQLDAAGLPPQVSAGFAAQGGQTLNELTAVGDLGARILSSVPPEVRPLVEPLIPDIVGAVHQAFSLATANTFLLGVVTSLVAAGLVLLLREVPIRGEAVVPGSAPAAPLQPAEVVVE